MKVEVEIDDALIARRATKYLEDANWMGDQIASTVRAAAREAIEDLDFSSIVKGYLDSKLTSVLEDVVAKQVRHIVKLAVDRELAVARETTLATEPRA